MLERDTAMRSDTVAKLLHEWLRPDRPPLPEFQLRDGATVVVDEAGMLSTPALHQLVTLAEANRWRLVLVGDHRQLQAVGRGGLFTELCANGRVDELEQLHRFTHHWEATASLLLRSGDGRALDAYEANGRIVPGDLDTHLATMASRWVRDHDQGVSVALVASTNDHVDAINRAVQAARLTAGHLEPDTVAPIAGGEHVHLGDVVATRRNDRTLITSAGGPVRNRETWTVTVIGADGSLTVTRQQGHGTVTLPADYAHDHVRLGYAATEHGYQSDTVDSSISLASTVTTRRGLYVAATRGRHENLICVVTDSDEVAEARDVLEGILAVDRADVPAVTQRRALAEQTRGHEPGAPAAITARCVIPEWFAPALNQAFADHAAAEIRRAERADERQRLHDAVAAVESRLGEIDAATAPDRHALDAAARRANQARRNHAAAQHRLDDAPRRTRRSLRHDVDLAEGQLERADAYLEHTRQRAAPSIEQYNHACNERDQARTDLRHHDVAEQVRGTHDSSAVTQRRVHALQTWQRWADGHMISDQLVRDTVDSLTNNRGSAGTPDRALGDALRTWTSTHGIDLSRAIGPRSTGIEMGV